MNITIQKKYAKCLVLLIKCTCSGIMGKFKSVVLAGCRQSPEPLEL